MQCQMIIGSANGKPIRCEHEATREEIWNDHAGFVVVNLCERCYQCFRPTKHAPDVVESAASSDISPTPEVSVLQAESTPAPTQVM